jgi:cyclic peptide transporter
MMPEKISLVNLFHTKSKWFLFGLGLLGCVNALWTGCLLVIINNKISGKALPYFDNYSDYIYISLILVSLLFKYRFEAKMLKMNFNFSKEMLLSILDKLRNTSYKAYEEIKEERVRTAIEDVNTLESFPATFLASFNAAIMIIIAAIYLLWLNALMAVIMVAIFIILAFVFSRQNRLIAKDIEASRSLGDIYMTNLNDLLRGFREIKMNSERSNSIFKDHLTKNRNRFTQYRINAFIKDLAYRLGGEYVFYLVIGGFIFYLPVSISISKETANAFIITILFMVGPINTFVALLNNYTRFRVALKRINKLNGSITKDVKTAEEDSTYLLPCNEFKSLALKNVSYEYLGQDGTPSFKLLPFDFTINKGDVIFISGGNGSGKSTFINLLTGIYSPGTGAIYFNDSKITENNIQSYRNKLSCIFMDGHMFNENYDNFNLTNTNKQLIALLEKMLLTGVVNLATNDNKLLYSLSKGQNKRLALIYSLLENNDIIILDEWAAEQDPEFRKYFYQKIIPHLKEIGKTVIAITHDDSYFSCADRLIKFEYGKISDITYAETKKQVYIKE